MGEYICKDTSSKELRRRQWHPTPVLLPGKSHGQRSLVGCSPWGRYYSDMTERLHFHFSLSCIGEGNGNPLQCSCLETPRDGGAWWAAIYGVAQNRTWLKWLSSSSSSSKGLLHKYKELLKLSKKMNKPMRKTGQRYEQTPQTLKKIYTKANKHIKRCSTLYVTREMQIKIARRYYCIRITKTSRIAKSKTLTIPNAGELVVPWELVHFQWECKTEQPILENSLALFYKTKLTLSIWPSNDIL